MCLSAGALAILILGEAPSDSNDRTARWLALGSSIVSLLMTVAVWHSFQSALGSMQFEERHGWVPSLNIEYHLGVDGLGLLMVLLSAVVVPMAILASWQIKGRFRSTLRSCCSLQAGLFGTFTALNFFHWFIFWELSLIPAFFLIKLWGGPMRSPAATQFFVYTMVGSVALLLAFLGLFLATGSFDFIDLAATGRNGQIMPAIATKLSWHGMSGDRLALILFFGALLGFAVKVPLMPFHTWLPTAYAEAPTGTSMLLTGVMSKMGVYGFLRILLPIFPEQMFWMRTPLLVLAVVNDRFFCLRGICAKRSEDDPRLLVHQPPRLLPAWNFCRRAAVNTSGRRRVRAKGRRAQWRVSADVQSRPHGGVLFWFVALLEKRSGGLRGLNDFGGLRKVAPVFCGLMGIALFSSLGLPGLNGFVGEFLIFKGVFPLASWAAAFSVIGLLVTAIFILTILQRVFNGPLNEKWAEFADLSRGRECSVFLRLR